MESDTKNGKLLRVMLNVPTTQASKILHLQTIVLHCDLVYTVILYVYIIFFVLLFLLDVHQEQPF
jgi:hypothetical protein